MRKNQIAHIFILLLLFASMACGWFTMLRRGIWIGETFCPGSEGRFRRGSTLLTYQKGEPEDHFSLLFQGSTWSGTVSGTKDSVTVRFDNGTVFSGSFSEGELRNAGRYPVWASSAETNDALSAAGLIHQLENGVAFYSEAKLASQMAGLHLGYTESHGSLLLLPYIGGIAVFLLAAFVFLFPKRTFSLGRRWQFENAEPSDAGLKAEKIGASIGMLLAALIISGLPFLTIL